MAGGIFVTSGGFAQMNYTNLEWVDRTPIVGNALFHTASIVQSGKLIVTGNTINGNGDADVLTIKYDSNGDTLWMVTSSGSANGDDYGVDLKADASGNVYVVAAVKNTYTGYDYRILKYNSAGSLQWSYTWNGVANGDDVPTAINIDGAGAIGSYVVGLSESSNGLSDYGIVKISSTGSLVYSQYYDYAHLHDGASGFAGGGSTTYNVTGVSAADAGDWDIATVTVNKSTGVISNTNRTNVTGATMEEAFAMTTDALNNVYITGYALSGDKDLQLVKLDSNLSLVYIVNYQGDYDDIGKDIGVDASGNVYVTGVTYLQNGGSNFLTIKFNSSGTQQWVREIGNSGPLENARAEKMSVDSNGDVYLTGTSTIGGQSKMLFVKYDTDGEIKLVRDYQSDTVNYEAYDINVYGKEVYITGLEKTVGINRLNILKYSIDERTMTPVLDTNDVANYIGDEVIISFNPDSIKHEIIDNKEITFGTLDEFVEPGIINLLDNKYPSVDWNKVRTYKIFIGLTTTDTLAITRQGHEIPFPSFWSTLVLSVPGENELAIIDSIDSTLSPHIEYAQTNFLFAFTTNDDLYTDQYSLYGGDYPNCDINILPAWSRETGKSTIEIGIYDSGIKYSHVDFQGIISGTTVIKGGKDYGTGGDLSSIANGGDPITTWYNGHGTSVAGIIGAYRHNSEGVAGVGGGAGGMDGLSLYGFRVSQPGNLFLYGVDVITSALLEGSSNTTEGYGYGLHIMNCSFGQDYDYDSYSESLMASAQNQIFRNGTLLVCSKGNSGFGDELYPSHARKEYWVMSVGGSDSLGNHHPQSSWHDNVDLMAPSDPVTIMSTHNTSNNAYAAFSGTSASAPFVSGVAGLMLSYINDQTATPSNLTPEDVEFLMQRYAVDNATAPATAGYDNYTGWGLLNAGAVFDKIDKSQYVIRHYYGSATFNTGSSTCLNCGGTLTTFYGISPGGGYAYGTYKGEVWEATGTHSHVLNPGDIILNSWPLHYHTNLLALNTFSNNKPNYYGQMSLSGVNNSTATWTGRIIHLTEDEDGNPVDIWYPFAPGATINYAYTLHLESDYAGVGEIVANEFHYSCYPNPTSSNLTVMFMPVQDSQISIEMFDLQGRLVRSIEQRSYSQGQQFVNFDVNNLSKGTYVVKIAVNDEFYYEKFIKE